MIMDRDEWLRRILAIHLHPEGGTPYWLERQAQLGFSLRKRICGLDDLPLLGPMSLEVLRERPIEALIPRSLHALHEKHSLVTAQTGGATGVPKTTAYSMADFESAFVNPFLDTVHRMGCLWSNQGHWLWIGPGGPHIIGKVAHRIALLTTGSDPFSVDFDPRWFRRLSEHSMARRRYLEHVLEQSMELLDLQHIHHLFTTPAILSPLAQRLSATLRSRITFIYLGGMRITMRMLHEFRLQFPNARFLSGYGNTLFGVCHQGGEAGEGLCYYPPSPQLVSRVVAWEVGVDASARLTREVPYGSRGQVVMHRLQESGLLLNVMEQDSAIRVPPQPGMPPWDGLADPGRLEQPHLTVEDGIY
ncbi:MAG: hypothetical protein HQL81_05130 [Magnetococcales bacterium]|nr:hypothetical protein [Magnetococcales bacterium]